MNRRTFLGSLLVVGALASACLSRPTEAQRGPWSAWRTVTGRTSEYRNRELDANLLQVEFRGPKFVENTNYNVIFIRDKSE
jgi:hypothetical protein